MEMFEWNTLEVDNPVRSFVKDGLYIQQNKWGKIEYRMSKSLFNCERFLGSNTEFFWEQSDEAKKNKKLSVDEAFSPFSPNAKLINEANNKQ